MGSKVQIGDIAESVSERFAAGSYERVVLVNTSDVDRGKVTNHKFVPNIDLRGQFKKAFKQGDILYSEIRPGNRRYAYIDFEADGYVASTKLMVIRPTTPELEARYLYHLLSSSVIVSYLQGVAESRSGTFPQITFDEIARLSIELPTLTAQKKIIAFIDSIEQKLLLNQITNDYLAELMLTRFAHWVETEDDPWGHSQSAAIGELDLMVTDYVANGSFASLKQNVELLNDDGYAYFMRNTDLKSGSFNVFVPEHSYKFLAKSVLYGGEVIISNVGDVGSVHRCPKLDKPMTLGNNVIMVKGSIKGVPANNFLYLLLNTRYGQHLIDSVTGGSVQRKFNKTDFRGIEIPLPTREGLNAFNSWSAPMFSAIDNIRNEIRCLEELRDALLPQLMSGEIDISKVVI